MNKQILSKCIAELQKSKPNLDYLRGMLETLQEMTDGPVHSLTPFPIMNAPVGTGIPVIPEPSKELSTPDGGMSPEEKAIVASLKKKK